MKKLRSVSVSTFSAPIGWAKPVPVDASRFRRGMKMSTGVLLTSAAGPLSNLLLAIVCAIVYGLLARLAPGLLETGAGDALRADLRAA